MFILNYKLLRKLKKKGGGGQKTQGSPMQRVSVST